MINANILQSNDQNVHAGSSTVKRDDFWAFHESLVTDNQSRRIINHDDMMPNDLRYYLNQAPITLEESPLKYWNMYPHSCKI